MCEPRCNVDSRVGSRNSQGVTHATTSVLMWCEHYLREDRRLSVGKGSELQRTETGVGDSVVKAGSKGRRWWLSKGH